jgi:hypothetical protein
VQPGGIIQIVDDERRAHAVWWPQELDIPAFKVAPAGNRVLISRDYDLALKIKQDEIDMLRARLAAMGDTLRVDPDAAPPTLSPAEAVKQTIEHLTAGRVRGKPLADLGGAVRKAEGDQAVAGAIGRRSPVALTEPGVPPRYGIAGPGYLP